MAATPATDKPADKPKTGLWEALTNLHRHKIPVIRPAKDSNDPAQRITARDLFGRQPQAAQFGARPDPAGASAITEIPHAENAPEAHDPGTDLTIDPDAAKDK
jgi:hypothetical protein